MNLKIQPISHPSLDWHSQPNATSGDTSLPGAILTAASGNFGILTIQEFHTEIYSIRYLVLKTLQHLVLRFSTTGKGIVAQLILSGSIQERTKGKWQKLVKDHYIIHGSPVDQLVSYGEGAVFHTFDIFASQPLLDEIMLDCPPLSEPLNALTQQTETTLTPHWAHVDCLDLIRRIFKCNYEGDLRRVYFKNRVRDLLIQYLVPFIELKPEQGTISEQELTSLHKAERIITEDLSRHFHIPQIAKMVGLNEFRLKILFKHIYGVGPYEYLVRQRMTYAKDLLDSGLSVKEAAAKTGYRSTNFITAFRDFYGFTPGRLKRK